MQVVEKLALFVPAMAGIVHNLTRHKERDGSPGTTEGEIRSEEQVLQFGMPGPPSGDT